MNFIIATQKLPRTIREQTVGPRGNPELLPYGWNKETANQNQTTEIER